MHSSQFVHSYEGKRELRPRRIVNLPLLIATGVILAIVMPAAYFWHQHQLRANVTDFLEQAYHFEKEGNWKEAGKYFQLYLSQRPDGEDANAVRLKMVEIYEKRIESPTQRFRLNSLLSQVIGSNQDDHGLRLKLAKNQLALGNYFEAETAAKDILTEVPDRAKPSADIAKEARGVIALARLAVARDGQTGERSPEVAVQAIYEAALESPDDLQIATVAAQSLRRYPHAVDFKEKSAEAVSDELMNEMVAANSEEPEAYLHRYKYRRSYGLPDANADLQRALELAPNDPEALFLSAINSTDRTLAESQLRKVIDAAPQGTKAYLALARLLQDSGQTDSAIETLKQAHEVASPDDLSPEFALVELLIAENRTQSVKEELKTLQQKADALLPRLPTPLKLLRGNQIRFLRAQASVAEGDFASAVAILNAIRASSGPEAEQSGETSRMASFLRLRTEYLLAETMQRLGRWELAADGWDRIARDSYLIAATNNVAQDIATELGTVYQRAAVAYLRNGNSAKAIDRLEQAILRDGATPERLNLIASAHMSSQLAVPPAKRSWTEFQKALNQAKAQDATNSALTFLEVRYLLTLDTPESRSQAEKLLRELESRDLTDSTIVQQLAIAYTQLGLTADCQRAVELYGKIEPSALKQIALQSQVQALSGDIEGASRFLVDALSSLSQREQRALQAFHVQLLTEAGKPREAQEVVAQMLKQSGDEPGLLKLGLQLAILNQDMKVARNWERELSRVAPDDADHRRLRAEMLLATYTSLEAKERSELRELISALTEDRRLWHRTASLRARLAQLSGDVPTAIQEYRRAIELGDSQSATISELVALLIQQNRFDEAQQYLARLSASSPDDTKSESLAFHLAIKQNRVDEALELAKKSKERNPKDVQWRIVYAGLLLGKGLADQAERELREAFDQFPNDIRASIGLIRFYSQLNKPEEIRKVLDAISENDSMSANDRNLASAEGFNALGEINSAIQNLEEVAKRDPKNIAIRLQLARLYNSSDASRARQELEQILRLDPNNAEARQRYAVLLAASGEDQDWNRAAELLKSSEDERPEDLITTNRTRAMLLTRRGRNREERLKNFEVARRLLQKQLASPQSNEVDRMLLAGIYEQESRLRDDRSQLLSARELMRPLVDRANPQESHMRVYIDFLLRAAEACRESSATSDDGYITLFLDDADSRMRELAEIDLGEKASMPTLDTVALQARLHQARGLDEAARSLIEDAANKELEGIGDLKERAQILLRTATLLSTLRQHDAAENWYRKLFEVAPSSYELLIRSLIAQGRVENAIELCLEIGGDKPSAEVATTLAQLATSASEDVDLAKLQSRVATALASNEDNINLQMAAAVMNVSKGESEEAIRLFRKVVAAAPNNTLALNNLATLLAENSNQLIEAQEHIMRAIEVAGRQPPLLDTLGTIQLRKGDYLAAVLNLEEAVAGEAADPRYHLHLAAAYDRNDQREDAKAALAIALQKGLDKQLLTSGDRDLLNTLKQKFPSVAKSS